MERRVDPGSRPVRSGNSGRERTYKRSIVVPHVRAEPAALTSPADTSVSPIHLQSQPEAKAKPVALSVSAHTPKRFTRPAGAPVVDMFVATAPSTAAPAGSQLSKQSSRPKRSVAKAAHSTHQNVRSSRRVVDGFSYVSPVVHKATPHAKKPKVITEMPQPVVEEAPSQTVTEAVEYEASQVRRRKWSALRMSHAVYGLASMLFVLGLFVALQGWLAGSSTESAEVLAAQTQRDAKDENQPSEAKPSSSYEYVVAPDAPRTLDIPSINVSARVLRLGMKSDGTIETPKNIFDTGWYSGSAKPTDSSGAVVLTGYVSGPTKQGIFHNIKRLNTGDKIVLERGDGQKLTFSVHRVETKLAENVDMRTLTQSAQPGKLGLTIITSDNGGDQYDSRTLVFAVLQ